MAALKAELAGMKTGALNKRAREVGVGADAMDDAADADDPRAALIALIVAASTVSKPGGQIITKMMLDIFKKDFASMDLNSNGILEREEVPCLEHCLCLHTLSVSRCLGLSGCHARHL